MKRIFNILLLMIMLPFVSISQQLPQMSQHMYNRLVLNPAFTGTQDYIFVGLSHRSQWTGFEGSPRTQHLSVHSKIKNRNFGLGGYFVNDKTGPLRNTGVNMSYAYHLKMNSNQSFLSFGASATLTQFSIDGGELEAHDETDDLLDFNSISSSLVPEIGFGILWGGANYNLGFAAQQLLGSEKGVFTSETDRAKMSDVGHYYFTGSYTAKVDDEIAFIPSILVNMAKGNPTQIDVNLRMALSRVEMGVGYRTNDALIALFNISLTHFLDISYSYDFQTSTLNQYNGGSHEFMIRYRLFYDEMSKKSYLQTRNF